MAGSGDRELWWRAVSYAARKHEGARRKDGATPYIAHPFRVAMILRHVFGEKDPTVLCAALLHDTIEDTDTDYDDLLKEFGADVADIVTQLTKDKRLPEDERDATYYGQLASASREAKLVKLADAYDNVRDSADLKDPTSVLEKTQRVIAAVRDAPALRGPVSTLAQLVREHHGRS